MQVLTSKLWDSKEWSSGDIRIASPDNKVGQNWRCWVTEYKSLTVELLFDKQQWTKNEVWNEINLRTHWKWFPQFGRVHIQIQMIK